MIPKTNLIPSNKLGAKSLYKMGFYTAGTVLQFITGTIEDITGLARLEIQAFIKARQVNLHTEEAENLMDQLDSFDDMFSSMLSKPKHFWPMRLQMINKCLTNLQTEVGIPTAEQMKFELPTEEAVA